MKTIFDPLNLWLGASPFVLAVGNKRPVAVDDVLTLVKDSGSVSVSVLENDFDPEGAPLTLVSAYASLGTAVAEPDNTVTYTPPPGLSGFDTVVYEIADDLNQRRSGQINITITEPELSIEIRLDNTLVINAANGDVALTVTDPAGFAGTYQVTTADLLGGPINLAAPVISGTPAEGQVLTADPGLWVYDVGAGVPGTTWQWHRGGADIAGQTSASYTVTSGDIGPGLSVTQILTDSFGQRNAVSAVVGNTFVPADDAQILGWWDANDAATITENAGLVSAWGDKAGGAALTQSTTRQPTTGSRFLNGMNVLDFSGSKHLERTQAHPASGNVAFHMVFAIDATSNAFEAILAVDATNDFQIDANNASQFDGRLNAAGIGSSASFSGGPYSGALLLSVVFDLTGAGQSEVFLGNISRGTASYTTAIDSSAVLYLMTNRSKNAWVDGAVAEVIVTGDISVSNRAAYHSYLANKWGV